MESCNKIYHLTPDSAGAHADELEASTGERPNIYQCDKCGQWHVGFDKDAKLSKRGRRQRNAAPSTRKRRKRRKRRGWGT